jgi:diguanylate cyclase (GGDEF)-like protein
MDFLTAGIAVIATQLCMALAMAGIYFVGRNEKCTGYWALAEALIATGVLLVVINAGAPRYAVIVLGNNSLIWGAILQWWGIQAFYGEQSGRAGWVIGAVFFVLHGLLLVAGTEVFPRVLLFSLTLLVLLVLSFRTLWRGTALDRTFSSWLVLGAITLLIANNVVRIAAVLLGIPGVQPITHSSAVVIILYLVPLIGILLYAIGLLLLYFEQIVKEKHQLATHDELTGLLNRRAIVTGGEREGAVAVRNRQPLVVALIDVDFFKQINDRLGHEAGDEVLIEIAQLLKKSCRNIDLVGRYGGEEFCIVFPRVDSAHAAIVGERLMATARQYRFRNQYPVTVSAGFAALSADETDRSWSNLINRADAELYKAKNLGRNRFSISESGTAPNATDTLGPAEPGASLQRAF